MCEIIIYSPIIKGTFNNVHICNSTYFSQFNAIQFDASLWNAGVQG